MEKLWIVRANGGELIPFFIENNVVALGWGSTSSFEGKDKKYIKQELYKALDHSVKRKASSVWAKKYKKSNPLNFK